MVRFPAFRSYFSYEKEWSPSTNAKFSSLEPTDRMLGRVTADIHDTRKDKDPCSFLNIFKAFANNTLVSSHLKCSVDKSNTPRLHIGDAEDGLPVESASVTRLYDKDEGEKSPSLRIRAFLARTHLFIYVRPKQTCLF